MFNRPPRHLPPPHVADPALLVKARELREQQARITALRTRLRLQQLRG